MNHVLQNVTATLKLLVSVVALTIVGIFTYIQIMERSGAWPTDHNCDCQYIEIVRR